MSRLEDSCLALSEILNGKVLTDFQTGDLLTCLVYKNGIPVWDTGMGKTLLAAAIIKAFHNEVPTRKFLFFAKSAQLIQTPKELREYTGLKVSVLSGVGSELMPEIKSGNFLKADILVISHSLLASASFMKLFYNFKDRYFGVIVDEIHELSNFNESASGAMMRAVLRNYKVRYGLTATPITSHMKQAVKLAHMIDWVAFENIDALITELRYSNDVRKVFGNMFMVRARKDVGIISHYSTDIVYVDPHPHQINAKGSYELFRRTKGTGAANQAEAVYQIYASKQKGEKGLVYVHYKESMGWLASYLHDRGVPFRFINGDTSDALRAEYLEELRKGTIDLLLTSVTTALHMSADYVIFYEYTTKVKQMLGRADRGLNPKILRIYFIFTRDTDEMNYFYRNIYLLSFWIKEVFKQDYSVFIDAGRNISQEE